MTSYKSLCKLERKTNLSDEDTFKIVLLLTFQMITSPEPLILKSSYVPPYALQGQNFSGHIIWNKDYKLTSCKLKCDEGISFERFYNVGDDHILNLENTHTLEISSVVEEGYLGIVFSSNRMPTVEQDLATEVDLTFSKDGNDYRVKELFITKFFRQNTKVILTPEAIEVSPSDDNIAPKISEKVQLRNSGAGTSILFIELENEQGEMDTEDYFESAEDRNRYFDVLEERLEHMRSNFPERSEILEELINVFKNVRSGENELALSSFQNVVDKLEDLGENDEDFAEDLGSAFMDAFIVTFQREAEFSVWVQQLKTDASNKVILLNPWSSVKLNKGTNRLRLAIKVRDVLGYEYETERSAFFKVNTNIDFRLPIFELLEVVDNNEPNTG